MWEKYSVFHPVLSTRSGLVLISDGFSLQIWEKRVDSTGFLLIDYDDEERQLFSDKKPHHRDETRRRIR
jgi:hypothetical protein